MRRQVEWADLDPGQHVNNARFLALVEECALQATAARGWPPERLHSAGLRLAPRRHQIEYVQPGLFGEELEFVSWLSGLDAESAIRGCLITRNGGTATLVRARAEWTCCEIDSAQVVPMPETLCSDLLPASQCHD
jgi:YbgC/YbaW family acyl-CoA thioester hydrolase